MDALEKSDLEADLGTRPTDKLRQALELMSTGLRLQRTTIKRQNPGFDAAELEKAFQAWLFSEDEY